MERSSCHARLRVLTVQSPLARRLPLNVVPLRPLVQTGTETILKLDSWLVVVHKDGHFHVDGCPCTDCEPADESYLAA